MNDWIANHAAALTGAGIVLAVVLVVGLLALLDPERLDPTPRHARRRRPGADPFEVELGGECYPCAADQHSGCDDTRCTCCGTEPGL